MGRPFIEARTAACFTWTTPVVAVPNGTALHRGWITALGAVMNDGLSPSLTGRPFIEAPTPPIRAPGARQSPSPQEANPRPHPPASCHRPRTAPRGRLVGTPAREPDLRSNPARTRAGRLTTPLRFPVAGDRAVGGFGRTFADHDIRCDMPLRLVTRPGSWFPQRPAGAQAGDQLPFQRAAPFDEQRLVDRLMADAHGLIIREIDPEPAGDLLRAPRHSPPPVLPVRLVQSLPRRRLRSGSDRAIGPADASGEPFLHVLTQPVVACASFAVFGRLAACCAFHCATRAR